MNRVYRKIDKWLAIFGINAQSFIYSFKGIPQYIKDYRQLKNQSLASRNKFSFGQYYPCLVDRYMESGSAKGHYFHQDLVVARRIFANNPIKHVDVGSRVDGFIAHVAAFRQIEIFDIRPLSIYIPNIIFKQANLMTPIVDPYTNYCDSLSCLHALEHFGLGRYGDPLQYDGYLQGLDGLYKILKANGKLYFSVPIGPQRIEFNAHRVFSVQLLLELFENKYTIDHFSVVNDNGDLIENIHINNADVACNYGCVFGCGIFELTKS